MVALPGPPNKLMWQMLAETALTQKDLAILGLCHEQMGNAEEALVVRQVGSTELQSPVCMAIINLKEVPFLGCVKHAICIADGLQCVLLNRDTIIFETFWEPPDAQWSYGQATNAHCHLKHVLRSYKDRVQAQLANDQPAVHRSRRGRRPRDGPLETSGLLLLWLSCLSSGVLQRSCC